MGFNHRRFPLRDSNLGPPHPKPLETTLFIAKPLLSVVSPISFFTLLSSPTIIYKGKRKIHWYWFDGLDLIIIPYLVPYHSNTRQDHHRLQDPKEQQHVSCTTCTSSTFYVSNITLSPSLLVPHLTHQSLYQSSTKFTKLINHTASFLNDSSETLKNHQIKISHIVREGKGENRDQWLRRCNQKKKKTKQAKNQAYHKAVGLALSPTHKQILPFCAT